MAQNYYNNDEVFEKLKSYIQEHEWEYPEEVLQVIMYRLSEYRLNPQCSDIMNQIYEEMGILRKEDNPYLAFAQHLKRKYSLDRHVIDVGGGFLPTLGKEISKLQFGLQNGTVTVYDPFLLKRNYVGIELKKEKFTENEIQTGNELLVGFFPCSGGNLIIQTGLDYDLDFSIQLCGCIHGGSFQHVDEYHQFLIDQIKKALPKDRMLDIDYLDSSYQIPYPILSSVKRKVKVRETI